MLVSLRLINFRRHVDTEINFSDDAQIIAITGRNGSGKSTLLEAITYALYGESRHGRRYLSLAVRRGAEAEGMQVDLTFQVAGTEYFVSRRHERGKTTAILRANGNDIMRSPDGVTAEIRTILGMDAAGFQLAIIARQNDVMALSDLRPARRRQTITRLLRQDALTKAKGAAADEKNRNLSVLRAFGETPDLEILQQEVKEVQEDLDGYDAALADSKEALTSLENEILASATVAEEWQAAQIAHASAAAEARAVESEVTRVRAELVREEGAIPVVTASDPGLSFTELDEQISDLSGQIASGEQAKQVQKLRADAVRELNAVSARLVQVTSELGGRTVETARQDLEKAREAQSAAEQRVVELRKTVTAVNEELIAPRGELSALRGRMRRAEELGAVCDACEQEISQDHKHTQQEQHRAQEAELTAVIGELEGKVGATQEALQEAEVEAVSARERAVKAATVTHQVEVLATEVSQLAERKGGLEERVASLKVEDINLDALYVKRSELGQMRKQLELFREQERLVKEAERRVADLAGREKDATERLEKAQAAVAGSKPSPKLVEAHARLEKVRALREAEQKVVHSIQTEHAKSRERLRGSQRLLEEARTQAEKAFKVRSMADRAAKAARLLDETAERMATQIRPALEGEISAILTRMSEGRFTSVKLDDNYDVKVEDDGDYRPLMELSGGEQVLVALSTRLALSQVVAGRQPHGGLQLLVLDEVFGSQDTERREAIMQALRAMRSDYGQILLISHVGGIDEGADRVIDVQLRQDESAGNVAEVNIL